MHKLDDFDRAILSLLETNSRRTGQQLSDSVGLSPAACLRRLQRLRCVGAIEREVAVISANYRPEGRTQIIVSLKVIGHNPKRVAEVTRDLARLPEVERIFSVTGEDDLVLLVICASMEAFTAFAEAHFEDPAIEGYTSRVVLRDRTYSR
ncbi:MAG: Lrp/AsnC family transcriptional regulator [Pseudomonadota bacterium]